MSDQDHLTMLARVAERVVRDGPCRAAVLHDPTVIAQRERSLVVRCAVMGWQGVESVVLKQQLGDDARGFSDWAGLQFLSSLEAAAGAAPRFYAGAVEERLVVMEDLGPSRTLADVLEHGDATAVVDTVRALAASMARLVTATISHEEDYRRLRASLPGAEDLGRQHEAGRWLAALDRVVRWTDLLGVHLPAGFETACAHVAAEFAEPGPYLVFSHGDPAPSNNHLALGRVSLVDFEYGGYRHALYDLTAWNILCPLPGEWFAAMDDAFKQAVGTGPLADVLADHGRYREARATMCAYRALAMLTWFSPEILQQDREWAPGWTQRQALISTALRLQQMSADVQALEPLAELGRAMAAASQSRWPDLGDGAIRWPGVADLP